MLQHHWSSVSVMQSYRAYRVPTWKHRTIWFHHWCIRHSPVVCIQKLRLGSGHRNCYACATLGQLYTDHSVFAWKSNQTKYKISQRRSDGHCMVLDFANFYGLYALHGSDLRIEYYFVCTNRLLQQYQKPQFTYRWFLWTLVPNEATWVGWF